MELVEEVIQETKSESPLVTLEQDLKLYNDAIREVAFDILNENLSEFPVFIAHQHQLSIGHMFLDKEELNTRWSLNASTMEELIERKLIASEREPYFIRNYKDPKLFICLLVIVNEGANFVFYPYK
jgi:hypothetical protein